MASMQHVLPRPMEVRASTAKPEGDRTLAPLTWALPVKNEAKDCANSEAQNARQHCHLLGSDSMQHQSPEHKS